MRPDSNFVHRSEPKANNSRLGRIDRGQPLYHGSTDKGEPLYHGGIEPGDDGYDDFEFEAGINSLELEDGPKFGKGRKS